MTALYRNFGPDDLAREYSPSSCIDDIGVYIQQYIDLSAQARDKAGQYGRLFSDLSYGLDVDECLDLFTPKSPFCGKLQVYIHGGYWQELSKNESAFAANAFQQQGCHFAAINYSLAPKANLSDIVAQVRRAIAWLYQNAGEYGYSAEQIYLSGSSAGAHLAMMMLDTQWSQYVPQIAHDENLVKGLCCVSGVYDLTPIAHTYIDEPLNLSAKDIAENSPLLTNQLHTSATIIAYGDNETSEFKRQSQQMHESLLQQGISSTHKQITNRNHFDVVIDLALPESWLFQQVMAQMSVQ